MPREKKDKGKGKAKGPYDKGDPEGEDPPKKHIPVPRVKPGAKPWTPRDPSFFARLQFREPEELALGEPVFPQAGPSKSSRQKKPSTSSPVASSSSSPSSSAVANVDNGNPAPASSSPVLTSSPMTATSSQGQDGEVDYTALSEALATMSDDQALIFFGIGQAPQGE